MGLKRPDSQGWLDVVDEGDIAYLGPFHAGVLKNFPSYCIEVKLNVRVI